MAEVMVGAGVVADLASGKELGDVGDRIVGELRRGGEGKPLYHTAWAAEVTPASGVTTTILRLGKPPSGRIWNLVYLTVTGPDDRTAVAGAQLASYVGDPQSPMLHGLIDPANGTSVPHSTSWSKDEIWVHDNEELFVVVYGAPTNTALSAVARLLNYAADDREASRI